MVSVVNSENACMLKLNAVASAHKYCKYMSYMLYIYMYIYAYANLVLYYAQGNIYKNIYFCTEQYLFIICVSYVLECV